jgi:hypothetical protein
MSSQQKDIEIVIPVCLESEHVRHRIELDNWDRFYNSKSADSTKSTATAILNASNASFADSMIITSPVILIQSKQSINQREKRIKRNTISNLNIDVIKNEHNKCKFTQPHIFFLISDLHFDENLISNLSDNEYVISSNNEIGFYGQILAYRKLFLTSLTDMPMKQSEH